MQQPLNAPTGNVLATAKQFAYLGSRTSTMLLANFYYFDRVHFRVQPGGQYSEPQAVKALGPA
ncbi:hypothetical protein AB0904_14515 [Streptomyces sp. NPDC006684]|uniref:hypothetical protein n=1 Tax=Streptomyces sp. NPDC006684 TaxID=3154477 RepID=UPI0034521652